MKYKTCMFCGRNPIERFIRIGFVSAEYDPDAPAPPFLAGEGIGLCIKGGCFLRFKESYWRLVKKYRKHMKAEAKAKEAPRRQEVPE